MDSLLTPIRITSLRTTNPDDPPIDLKLSSTTLIRPVDETNTSAAAAIATPSVSSSSKNRNPTSPEDALEILRSQPSLAELSTALEYLHSQLVSPKDGENTGHGFNPSSTSAFTSRIVNALIVDIIPSFWGILTSPTHKAERKLLLHCLRNVTGLGGVIERIRLLLRQVPSSGRPKNVSVTRLDVGGAERKEGVLAQIRDLMEVLGYILRGNGFLALFWEESRFTSGSPQYRKREMAWKEFVGLIAGGRILSVAAEADIALSEADETVEKRNFSWIAEGKEYSSWLRGNISKMLDETPIDDIETWKAAAGVLARGFGLGYNDNLIDVRLYLRPSSISEGLFSRIRLLLSHLKEHERRIYINVLLKLLSQTHLPAYAEDEPNYIKRIGLVTKIIHEICIFDEGLEKGYQDILVEWILVDGGPGSGEPIGIRRAIISAIRASSNASTILRECLDSQVQTFGENLWVRHAPIMHQEVNVQCLLLCAGYIHRQPPIYLKILARSSSFMNGISNHLATTNTRVRFLGMIVGETISTLVDQDGKQLKFTDALDASEEEATKWRQLTKVDDKLPGFEIFKDEALQSQQPKKASRKPVQVAKKLVVTELPIGPEPTVIDLPLSNRIQELDSDSDDDLIPYPKPDSDPEDSDDDATLVNRKKPTPPVYIRDLLYMLNDQDSYDRQQMAFLHAAVLIRRKATFGTELSSHAVDLLTVLVGQQDKFDMPNFDTLRLKAVVSTIVSLPLISGPWISQRIFEGDYSLAQRCVMLSAVGISATELSGETIPADSPLFEFQLSPSDKQKSQFPSKTLPKRLHDIYASTPVDNLTSRLKSTLLHPLAEKAADELSPGPSLLKVRTFSTRMQVEARREKPRANKLSQIVVQAFFGPLMGRWWVFVKEHGNTSGRLAPHLLSLYVKTLTVLLHATGPNGLMVPQMVDGFWDLLLSLRHNPIALENSSVLDAVLVGLLTMFEVCKEDKDRRRMAEEKSKELVETQEWVGKVFEGSDGSEGIGEERKGLAAAVLLRCREVVERYERILMGDLIG
ncbi:telomere binding protein [Orbilia ellipsospora]|uniref:Telomere binding protein n=1 Tax=Orbilia ellipsospora TaxID=2528407 RepID=A0AAV9XHD0_9PEZI